MSKKSPCSRFKKIPWRRSGAVVDCHGDDHDIRPALDVLEDEISRRLRRATPERPLIVLMSEDHQISMHIALRQGLMGRLLNGLSPRTGFAFGEEGSHNFVEGLARDTMQIVMPEAYYGRWDDVDPHGQHRLDIYGNMRGILNSATVAVLNQYAFCRRNAISTRFNDVAIRNLADVPYLNEADSATMGIIARYQPDNLGSPILAEGVCGMKLRNWMMAHRAMIHCREAGVPLYIQACGEYHAFGAKGVESFADSLCARFNGLSADVMPVFISSDLDRRPKEARHFLRRQGVSIHGLSFERYEMDDNDWHMVDCGQFAGLEEYQHLQAISARSGGELPIFHDHFDAICEDMKSVRRGRVSDLNVTRHFSALLQQAGMTLGGPV